MARVLITGADGMLGTDIVAELSNSGHEIIGLTINDVDITDLAAVRDAILSSAPKVVIHTAAYTAVDRAEEERERCFAVNAEGTKNIAFFCRELGVALVYISTDYVFDGTKASPYLETDKPNPLNVYGASKLLGEQYVQTLVKRHKIVRTSWLCGIHTHYGRNFVEAILDIAKQKSRISVVNDQFGKPTFTFHLAEHIGRLLAINEDGIFHVTNEGRCSWYQFACEVIKQAGLDKVKIVPIPSKRFRSLAKRPVNSVLANRRTKRLGLPSLPHWKKGLQEYLRRRELNAASAS
jgi:dTDP-4-dehydrorhamnose reductase